MSPEPRTRARSDVRSIGSKLSLNSAPSGIDRKTVNAQLSVTPASLARLLRVTGSQSDFVLASADGATSVRVDLAVSSVPDALLSLGTRGVVLDWSRSTITLGENRAVLTRSELRLLVALMEHAPKAAPREQLVSRMWQGDATREKERDAALCVWILALRRRFAAIGIPDAIRTVRGKGYSLSL